MPQEIRTRFAPSPTGLLHIGGLRTALYAFLFARNQGGKFILRIEDTDQKRSVPGALENIIQTLADFSLNADEGPYHQSERLEIYKKYAQELIDKKVAYYCFCTHTRLEELHEQQIAAKVPPKYDKHCLLLSQEDRETLLKSDQARVIRLNIKSGEQIVFTDEVHGEIKFSSDEIDDQVLLKSDGFPTYHLASVVDDHLMNITHIIRGDEWIPSTPKHILLYQAFGWNIPKLAHLPLLLSKTRKKLSKRDGDVSVKEFVEQGYLPDALLNFVAFLGWNPKTEHEIFSLAELVKQFSLDKINKAGAVFDLDKLDWFNGMYIRNLNAKDLLEKCSPYLKKAGINFETLSQEFVEKVLLLEQSRLKKLSEIGERVGYFFREPVYDPKLLIWKNTPKETILKNLNSLAQFLLTVPTENFKVTELEPLVKKFIEDSKMKNGEVLWPLRVALSGLEASPGPFEIMEAFGVLKNGKEIILKRITKATENLF
ncbi:MAG TPA: glutamate--tRNA ligase [Methylomirabilota bacterium]|jgi:glutamyl-tRNA synthetase|nr:glutamate--tRNA ligase [Methylomirabilota bacterium]